MWNAGRIDQLPSPYYGFQTTDFVGGHGTGVYGEYLNWLEQNHADALKYMSLRSDHNTYRGAFQCYNWGLPEELHYNRWVSQRSCSFLEEVAQSGEPFFLWCSFPDPHPTVMAPEPWCTMYDPEAVSPPVPGPKSVDGLPQFYKDAYANDGVIIAGIGSVSAGEARVMKAITYGMVSFIDQEVGRVMGKLEELGLVEDTIVIFVSDHGDMMGDHGLARKGPFQYLGAIQVPCVWNWRDHLSPELRSEGLASHLDFAPTILDLCGIPAHPNIVCRTWGGHPDRQPPVFPGRSLRPQLEGKAEKVHDYVIHENDMDLHALRIRTFITDRYRLSIFPGLPYGELFDLQEDPDELCNLWENPDWADVKNRLCMEFLEAYAVQDPATPKVMHTQKIVGQPRWR